MQTSNYQDKTVTAGPRKSYTLTGILLILFYLFPSSAYSDVESGVEISVHTNRLYQNYEISKRIKGSSRLIIAQSSNIIDFIPPFLKGLGNNNKQLTPAKPLPDDQPPAQESSTVKKLRTEPNIKKSVQRPARVFCVRLCDGYYWPIDKSALKQMAKSPAEFCAVQCTSPTEVFLNHKQGGTAEHLIDKSGNRYTDMKNSFLYRKKYIPSCRCRPNPWDAAEQQRHVSYEKAEGGALDENRNIRPSDVKEGQQLDAASATGWSVEVSRPN